MALKVALDTQIWIHWISKSKEPNHESIQNLMVFLLDVRNPVEIVLLDMVKNEIEYKIRTDFSDDNTEMDRRLNQLNKAIGSPKVYIEKTRIDEKWLEDHVHSGGDFQDAVIYGQLSNSISEYFITADKGFRKAGEWKTITTLKPGTAVKYLKREMPEVMIETDT